MSIEQTLNERGSRYGDFSDHAAIAQRVQDEMRGSIGWDRLSHVQKQALTVIADKIARILSGDPNYADNWHDIQGYAKLAEDRLPKEVVVGSHGPVPENEFDEARVDRVASSHGDGEHYNEPHITRCCHSRGCVSCAPATTGSQK